MNRAAAVAFTSFCLAVGLQAGMPINTAPIGPTPRMVGQPHLAAVSEGFLAFWPEGDQSIFSGGITIRGLALDGTGKARGKHLLSGATYLRRQRGRRRGV
jgi:hypothetical protein